MKLQDRIKQLSTEEGFTLIEMFNVVSIIGTLVAISVPALNKAKEDAQKKRCLLHLFASFKNT